MRAASQPALNAGDELHFNETGIVRGPLILAGLSRKLAQSFQTSSLGVAVSKKQARAQPPPSERPACQGISSLTGARLLYRTDAKGSILTSTGREAGHHRFTTNCPR